MPSQAYIIGCILLLLPISAQTQVMPTHLEELLYDSIEYYISSHQYQDQAQLALRQQVLRLEKAGDSDSSLMFLKEIDRGQKFLHEQEQAFLLLIQASLLVDKGLPHDALGLYEEALDLLAQRPEMMQINARIALIKGQLYFNQSKFQEALDYFNQGIRQAGKAIVANPQFDMRVRHNLGVCLLNLERYDEAAQAFGESLALKTSLADTLGLAKAYMELANLYYEQYLDDIAIPYFIKSFELARIAADSSFLRTAYFNMAVVEENRGQYQQALAYRIAYEKLDKAIESRERLWQFAKKQQAWEASLAQKDIDLLSEQQRSQALELQKRNLQRWSLIGIACFLLIILLVLLYGNKKLRQSSRIISNQRDELATLNQDKTKLFSIVAHDLKSPMISLRHLEGKARQALDQHQYHQLDALLTEHKSQSQKTYQLLDNVLIWALEQSEGLLYRPETIPARLLIEQAIYEYLPLMEQKAISWTLEDGYPGMIRVDHQMIKILIRNLIDNSIRFTPSGGHIILSSSQQDHNWVLVIKDSGSGFPESQWDALQTQTMTYAKTDKSGRKSTGLGLRLCKNMLDKHQGYWSMKSNTEQGTQITIHIPQAYHHE